MSLGLLGEEGVWKEERCNMWQNLEVKKEEYLHYKLIHLNVFKIL